MCFAKKPLAMNSQESRSLVDAATQSGLVCGVNYNIRFYPLCIEAAAKVQRGELGTLFHITGSYTQDWLLHSTDFNWRVKSEEGGPLRALADIGTHWLDLIQNISGLEVESVVADLQTVYPIRKTLSEVPRRLRLGMKQRLWKTLRSIRKTMAVSCFVFAEVRTEFSMSRKSPLERRTRSSMKSLANDVRYPGILNHPTVCGSEGVMRAIPN